MNTIDENFKCVAFMEEGNISYCFTNSMDMFNLMNKEKKHKIMTKQEYDSLNKEFLYDYVIDESNNVSLDVNKCKETTKTRLRNERTAILQSLDIEFMRALEESNDKTKESVLGKKKFYRNITKLADSCSTPEELSSLRVKDYSSVMCTVDDLRSAGFCAQGSKEWFEQMGWDFKDFVRNGKPAVDFFNECANSPGNQIDQKAISVIEFAHKRTNKI